ncbi:MAG TPA: phosphoribosylanthranilate isomerase [Cyclobacteriaceae bacterium]
MIKLKICGMRDAANIKAVAELRPDYMGFIFYEKSPRFVGHEFKVSGVNAVGVFVNESTQKILEKGVEIVQLHGDEPASQVDELKGEGLSVIKAFSVDDNFDFTKTKNYKADYFLFDTKGKYYGGNAKTFNWKKLEEYDQRTPFFLSGGLNADNLKDLDILKGMNLHAIDLNSGVEDAPGIKNIEKIKSVMSCLK